MFTNGYSSDPNAKEPILDFFGVSVKAEDVPQQVERMYLLKKQVTAAICAISSRSFAICCDSSKAKLIAAARSTSRHTGQDCHVAHNWLYCLDLYIWALYHMFGKDELTSVMYIHSILLRATA